MSRSRTFILFSLAAFVSTIACAFAAAADESKPAGQPASLQVAAIAIAELKRDEPVSFEKEILPFVKENCLACHGATKPKAALILETPDTISKGGDSGAAVVPGKAAESLLLKAAAKMTEPYMPPKDNKAGAKDLTPDQLGLLKLWIDQGATGVVSAASAPVHWQALPAGFNPINAVAVSPDGQFAACGRANQVFVYHVPTGVLVTRLTDPALIQDGKPGIADRDVIQSLAFSPDGTLLASGGYRAVKLWRREPTTQRLTIMHSVTGAVATAAASPDGKWFATGGSDAVIRVWDTEGKLAKELAGHSATAIRFSSDSAKMASVSHDKTLRIWNVADGQLALKIDAPAELNAVAWLSDGKQVAAAGNDKLVRVWDVSSAEAKLAKELAGHTDAVTSLDSRGTVLLSGSRDRSARVWDVEAGKQIRQVDHGDVVTSVAIRPDCKRFATGGENHLTKLWNAEDGKLIFEFKGDPQAQQFAAAAERTLVFSKSEGGYHKGVLDAAQKQLQTETESVKKAAEAKAAAEKTLSEKQETLKKITADKVETDKLLAAMNSSLKLAQQNNDLADKLRQFATTQDKTANELLAQAKASLVKAEESKTAAYQVVIDSSVEAQRAAGRAAEAKAAAEKDAANKALADARVEAEKFAAERSKASELAVDKASSAKAALEQAAKTHAAAEQAIAEAAGLAKSAVETKSAAEKSLADATAQQKEADAKAKAVEKLFADADKAAKDATIARDRSSEILQAAEAASKKSEEAVASAKSAVQTAEAVQKKAEADLEAARAAAGKLEKPVRALTFSSDSHFLFTGGDDNALHTWSAESGQPCETLRVHTNAIVALAVAADGNPISVGADQKVIVWKMATDWKLERTIGTSDDKSPLTDRVLALDFSRDGQLLATGGGAPSRNGEIHIWKVADGSLARELKEPHSDTVFDLNFSADGKHLASCGADKFVKIWNAETGALAKSFEGHTHHVLSVSWKRDGRLLASSSADKAVKIWDFASGAQKRTISGFGKDVTSIQFLDASSEALVSTGDNQVRLINDEGNNNVRKFEGATDFVSSSAATPDGRVVIAGGHDSTLRIWDGKSGKLLRALSPPAVEEPKLVSQSAKQD